MGAPDVVHEADLCKICGAVTLSAGEAFGVVHVGPYRLRSCQSCHFSFVSNPWNEPGKNYSREYYQGKTIDPLVNYLAELESAEISVRRYEWRGITRIVKGLVPVSQATRWLDFGCGGGGLVRYVRDEERCHVVGFEEGWIAGEARKRGLPILDRRALESQAGTFDVVTAIEVVEHISDPIAVFHQLRRMLKPGGLLFLTTGNAKAHRHSLPAWSYVAPEIHVSLFEPATLALVMEKTGFRPDFRGYLPGFTDIIRFKVLKNLKVHEIQWWNSLLPWEVLARIANARAQVHSHPVGWAV